MACLASVAASKPRSESWRCALATIRQSSPRVSKDGRGRGIVVAGRHATPQRVAQADVAIRDEPIADLLPYDRTFRRGSHRCTGPCPSLANSMSIASSKSVCAATSRSAARRRSRR